MNKSSWLDQIARHTEMDGDGVCTLKPINPHHVELALLEILFIVGEPIMLANDEKAADKYGFAEYLTLDSKFTVRGEFLEWRSKEHKTFATPEGEEIPAVEECTNTASVDNIKCVRLREFYPMNFDILDND